MAAQDKLISRKRSLLGRLRTMVKKVIILMKFNKNPWQLAASILGTCGGGHGRGGALSSGRWSFNDSLGLISMVSSPSHHNRSNSLTPYMTPSPEFSPEQGALRISQSFPLLKSNSFVEEDDIDKRSQMFIDNFHRRVWMEHQAYLKLRYERKGSSGSSSSSSGSF